MSKVVLYSLVKGVRFERAFDNLSDAKIFLSFNGFYNTYENFYEKELENGYLKVELVDEI